MTGRIILAFPGDQDTRDAPIRGKTRTILFIDRSAEDLRGDSRFDVMAFATSATRRSFRCDGSMGETGTTPYPPKARSVSPDAPEAFAA